MTALDDALNTNTPVFEAPTLLVDWKELPASEPTSPNADSMRLMSEQVVGAVTIAQSIDDALPDPVTMTSGSDASGSIGLELGGRTGVDAVTWGWRSDTNSASSVSTEGNTTPPSDVQHGDYEIVVFSIGSAAGNLTDGREDLTDPNRWRLLASFFDNTNDLRCWVWGRVYYDGSLPFRYKLDSVSPPTWTWLSAAFYARTIDGRFVPFKPGTAVGSVATTTTTSHTTPAVTLGRKGIAIGVWSGKSTYGAWTATGGATELGEFAGGVTSIMVSAISTDYPKSFASLSATIAVTGTDVVRIGIPLEVADRPAMDATEFFSPFNSDSPVADFQRDTAAMQFQFNVLGATGTIATTTYAGQMADIMMRGKTAELAGVSKTRLDLDRSVTLPVVKGDRENCSIDWLATWLMSRGGQFAGPGPGVDTRYWAPMYGSLHAFMDSPDTYANQLSYTTGFPSVGVRYPIQVPGPFVGGMFGEQTAIRTLETQLVIADLYDSREVFPHLEGAQTFQDQMSLQCSQGKLAFWIRGDAVVDAPAYLTGFGNYLMEYKLTLNDSLGAIVASLTVSIRASDRVVQITMAAPGSAYTQTFAMNLISGSVPTDGLWHFVGVGWDWDSGAVSSWIDGTGNFYGAGTFSTPSVLPQTHEVWKAAGGTVNNVLRFHVPAADVQIEAGYTNFNNWTRYYPTPPDKQAVYRRTDQLLLGIAQEGPVQTWETLAELCRAALVSYRVDEEDNFNFLPDSYFGEAAQMTPSSIADTDLNAGELSVKQDPSKIRNVVTVQFQESQVASRYSTVLAYGSIITIPPGVTSMVLALDVPALEIHLATPVKKTMTNLTAAQVTTPSTIPTNIHYVSINSASDGTGTYLSNIAVLAQITAYTSSSITITFTNYQAVSAYLTNNGTDLPYLRVLGYPFVVNPGYVTARDESSVKTRRERPLTVEMPWIQDRATASLIAQKLVLTLSNPRPEVTLRVMGDPRRKPGQLVTIADAEGTRAAGTWRILSVTHNSNGPEYTQEIRLVRILPIAVWDGIDGWDNAVWGV